MAVKGSKSRNTKAKGTKGNPTRTKVKTPNISPQQVSKYKNDATKATSKAILEVRKVTGTGPKSLAASTAIRIDKGHLGKKYGAPKFKVKTAASNRLASTLTVVKKIKKSK